VVAFATMRTWSREGFVFFCGFLFIFLKVW